MADVVPISITPIPNLHHNNVGVTYVGTSKFKMEPIRYVPLYYVAMPQSMVITIETPFVTTPTHIVVGMGSKPQTPRGIELMSVHTKMPRKVNIFFVGQPSNPIGRGSGDLQDFQDILDC
jgi:hypothetical protein